VVIKERFKTPIYFKMYEVRLKDLNSINLVKGYDIWPHYQKGMDKDIINYYKNYKIKVISIPEDSGLYVTEKSIEVIGLSSVFILAEDKKEIKPKGKII